MAGCGLFYTLFLLLTTSRTLAQFDAYDFDSEIFDNNYKYNEGAHSHHKHHAIEHGHHGEQGHHGIEHGHHGIEHGHHGIEHGHHGIEHSHHGIEHGHHELEYGHHEFDTDFHAHPKYTFDYAVKDPHTGDNKEHWETRDGDKVKGSYTLTETDGTKRVVEYEADDKNGFNAVVHKIGTPHELPAASYEKPSFQGANYKEKPFQGEKLFEPVNFHRDFQNNYHDDGFVPVAGNYE